MHMGDCDLEVCDWCLREVSERHRVDDPEFVGDYDLVCRNCILSEDD